LRSGGTALSSIPLLDKGLARVGYFIGRPANYEDNQQAQDANNGPNAGSAAAAGGR
jgi:hypothetical protein